jgi:hypothetical protein
MPSAEIITKSSFQHLYFQNSEKPIVSEISDGFKWPHFVLMSDILSEVDLLTKPEPGLCVYLYNSNVGI